MGRRFTAATLHTKLFDVMCVSQDAINDNYSTSDHVLKLINIMHLFSGEDSSVSTFRLFSLPSRNMGEVGMP